MKHVFSAMILCGAVMGMGIVRAAPVAAEIIPMPNGSFDEGEAHWFFSRERGVQTRATAEYFFTPPGALRIYADKDKGIGARVDSALIPVRGPGIVELRGKFCAFRGRHLGLWIKQYDADRKLLPVENSGEIGGQDGQWTPLVREVLLDEATAYMQLWFLPYCRDGEIIDVFFDDLAFVRIPMRIPPWTSQYKLKPGDGARLTAADVVGPDGVVYPDWKQVGVQGGIPDVPIAIRLADMGARPETDIADLLDHACRSVGDGGGGTVLLDAGVYYLDRPVTIRQNAVVIRGAGRDRTKLVFRYDVPESGVVFFWPKAGAPIGPDSQVELHGRASNLLRLRLFRGKHEVASVPVNRTLPRLRVPGSTILAAGEPGAITLRGVAEFTNGQVSEALMDVVLSADPVGGPEAPDSTAALCFRGPGLEDLERPLASDGHRGDTVLTLQDVGDLKVGEKFVLHAPSTDRWQTLIQETASKGWNRVNAYEIRKIEGTVVTINQPLRIDFPIEDGTYLRRLRAVEGCGVESLSLEHTGPLAMDSVLFDWAWNCWVRDVKVVKTGRNGIYAEHSKWIEVRDCELDRSWNNDGGQAYAGFTRSWDCLFEGCTVRGYRHGPVVQFGAQGCVFRNSLFEQSDLQWHAGWSTENLFENCVIRSSRGTGSYGYGAYATGSGDQIHGPNGPRNVVYNCDFTSELDGVKLDGVNENWLFLHNRFVVRKGAGFVATRGSFDHIIRGNAFVLKDGVSPMLRLLTSDCVGIELTGNTVYGGNGRRIEGATTVAEDKGNTTLPALKPDDALPARPKADPPSIYEWQQKEETR